MTHSFDVACACRFGLTESILLHHMRFWIMHNKANNLNYHEGRTWTYNTTAAFKEIFPYLSLRQIRYAIEKLLSEGVIIKENFHKNVYVHTSWYAFMDEKEFLEENVQNNVSLSSETHWNSICQNGTIDLSPVANRFVTSGNSKKDVLLNIINNHEGENFSEKTAEETAVTPAAAAFDFEARKARFFEEICAYQNQHRKNYPCPAYKDFFEYWSEPNPAGVKMRFEECKYFGIPNRMYKFWKTRNMAQKSAYWTAHYEAEQKKDTMFSVRFDPQLDLALPTEN